MILNQPTNTFKGKVSNVDSKNIDRMSVTYRSVVEDIPLNQMKCNAIDYINNVRVTISLLANALTFGHPFETISSRCYRNTKITGNHLPEKFMNTVFFNKNHCKESNHNCKIRAEDVIKLLSKVN